MIGAQLQNANLTDADLTGANLTNANLSGATITGWNDSDVIYCNTQMPDGTLNQANC